LSIHKKVPAPCHSLAKHGFCGFGNSSQGTLKRDAGGVGGGDYAKVPSLRKEIKNPGVSRLTAGRSRLARDGCNAGRSLQQRDRLSGNRGCGW
jgi:hypothetical protein